MGKWLVPHCISVKGDRRCTVCTERGSAAVSPAPATLASKTRFRRPTRSCESVTRVSTSSSRIRVCSRPIADISRPCWRARRRRQRHRRRRARPSIPPARPSPSRRPTDNRSDRSPPCRSRPLVNIIRWTKSPLISSD